MTDNEIFEKLSHHFKTIKRRVERDEAFAWIEFCLNVDELHSKSSAKEHGDRRSRSMALMNRIDKVFYPNWVECQEAEETM